MRKSYRYPWAISWFYDVEVLAPSVFEILCISRVSGSTELRDVAMFMQTPAVRAAVDIHFTDFSYQRQAGDGRVQQLVNATPRSLPLHSSQSQQAHSKLASSQKQTTSEPAWSGSGNSKRASYPAPKPKHRSALHCTAVFELQNPAELVERGVGHRAGRRLAISKGNKHRTHGVSS